MRVLSTIVAAIVSVTPAVSGDVSGLVVITKRLTHKTVAPTVYNLRGVATPVSTADSLPATEFERTVVLLEGGKLPAPPPVTAVIEQRNTRFEPDLIVIPAGSTVQFPNFDPIFHNVFSLSGTQPFDLGFYAKSQSRSVKFSRPGVVQVYCHIHSHMYAGIVVTASPFSAKPGADGSFSFAKVPAGHYRLVAWHKIAGLHHVEVDVPESGVVNVQIRVPVDVEPRP
jgi:plastocyanin